MYHSTLGLRVTKKKKKKKIAAGIGSLLSVGAPQVDMAPRAAISMCEAYLESAMYCVYCPRTVMSGVDCTRKVMSVPDIRAG